MDARADAADVADAEADADADADSRADGRADGRDQVVGFSVRQVDCICITD